MIKVLLMLIIVPILSKPVSDFSPFYSLRELFWFGSTNCKSSEGFFCNKEDWISDLGWKEMLKGFVTACGHDDPLNIQTNGLLWLHVPDFELNGVLRTI